MIKNEVRKKTKYEKKRCNDKQERSAFSRMRKKMLSVCHFNLRGKGHMKDHKRLGRHARMGVNKHPPGIIC